MAVLEACVCVPVVWAYAWGVCTCICACVCGECERACLCGVWLMCVCACLHSCVVLSIMCVCVCARMYTRVSALTMSLAPICHYTFHPTGINVKVWMQVFNHRRRSRVLKASFRKTWFGQGVFAFTAE